MDRDVSVREVMDREFVGVSESDGLQETAELMLEEDADSVVVLRGSEPVGVVTERDALETFVTAEDDSATVSDAMTTSMPTVTPDLTVAEAVDEMSTMSTPRVLVADESQVFGVLTEHDLMTASLFAPTAGNSMERDGQRAVAGVTAGRGEPDAEDAQRTQFENQSLCEACGSLSRDLSPFNGQLLCPDCRDI